MEGGRILHFAAGPRRLALPLSEVREIARIKSLVSVPGAPGIVGGLAEIRGRIVTILDPASGDPVPAAAPGDLQDGLLVVILTEPFDHLGVLIRGVPETEDVPSGAGPGESSAGTEPAARTATEREVRISGGRRVSLLEPGRLADEASRCVRAQFMVVR